MFQLEIQPHEHLVISSEDVRAMFYIIGLPKEWAPFLGFSRIIPTRFNPPGVKGPCVLFSRVLPMGFVNSVSLAQHIHRRVVSFALKGVVSPNCEIRRDRDFPDALQFYRVYLDNFDVLTLRSKEIISCSQPSLTLLLQEEYERLGVPRNIKKAVDHAKAAELQGAWIDGVAGIAYAKDARPMQPSRTCRSSCKSLSTRLPCANTCRTQRNPCIEQQRQVFLNKSELFSRNQYFYLQHK